MIRLLTKAKVHYSLFLISFNLIESSLKALYEALAFNQKEVNIRVHKWNHELNLNKKYKNRMNQAIKFTIMIVFHIGVCYDLLRNRLKFFESIVLAFELSKKFQIDDLMRWFTKIYTNILAKVFSKIKILFFSIYFICSIFSIRNIFSKLMRSSRSLLSF